MKSFFTLIISLCASAHLLAQKYEPTTLWPYAFAEFMAGEVYSAGGKADKGMLNIHLLHGDLHKLNGDEITSVGEAADSAVIGSSVFVKVDGCFCQILAREGKVTILKKAYGDFNKLMSGTGAYGTTLTASGRRELTSIEIGGINQTSHGILLQSRGNGQYLPIKTEHLVVVETAEGETVVEASSRSVRGIIPESRRGEWKSAVKSAGIKWGRDESAKTLASLLNSFLTK